ncbi:MAG: S8 family peptidase [Bdellovibrionales bacterium]|nr:S8 family peptidase [Bdellovibrionales bacterium]
MKYLIYPILFFTLSCSHLKEEREINQKQRNLELGSPYALPESEKLEWHLNITNTQKAWQISKGNKNIVVAIIDTGIDTKHPDLKNNLWVNQAEKNGVKGVDDDKNGFIDDIHGWNFADNSSVIMDYHGHGTHVAGIIGGMGKVCKPGVAPQVSLMVLKYYSPGAPGSVNLANTINSIYYAIRNGAHIINFSGGGPHPNEEERKAIELALEKNILLVTAGGNEKSDIGEKPYYPASYQLSNILAVGASDKSDKHSSFSNRGKYIKAHAPGTKIYSTLPLGLGRCGFLTGTSQSTPIFTGGAVLVKHYKQLDRPSSIIDYLSKTTDLRFDLKGKSETGGRANFYQALGSEDKNTAIDGSTVKYSDNMIGEVAGDEDKESSEIAVFKDILKLSQKSDTDERSPSSVEWPQYLISPSHWTGVFLEESSENQLD